MDATELGRWTRFAAKGGIGKCTALQDCVAEQPEDLMFMKDDEITVLMQIPGQSDLYLGYCEGVVGNFRGSAVRFHGRLKKPILTKRQSTVSPVSRPSSSQSAVTVAARDNPSPAITANVSSSSISAASSSPTTSPLPERSTSHASSLATAASSAPITPADDRPDGATIASDTQSPAPSSPIRLTEIAKQLATDSPVDPSFDSIDHSTFRFPPQDRDLSVYDDSEPSTRISVALSDGGVGIGLSLLQDFAGGGDDDADGDDDAVSLRRTQSPESTVEGVPDTARSDSQYSQSPRSVAHEPPLSARSDTSAGFPKPPLSVHSESQYSDSPQSSSAPLPSAQSESDYGGEDWEGADDIYDDYRYSRYSMASKISRFSKGSMYTVASTSEVVPPIPTEHSRPSLDSIQREGSATGRDPKSSREAGPSKLSESSTSEQLLNVAERGDESVSKLQKNRPAPLTFKKEPEPSPLLHTTFGSPQASPTVPSATTASFASPTLVSPVYPTNTGAATNIRKRLELEREGQRDNHSLDGEASTNRRRSSQNLVGEDCDDAMPMTAVSQAAEVVQESSEVQRSLSPTPAVSSTSPHPVESAAQAEKRMITTAEPSPDQPPPPPYSVAAPPLESTSQAPTPQPGSSTSQPAHPQARPVDPTRPPPGSQTRQSLFLPHPGAPKPTSSSAGPMYGRQPAPHIQPGPTGPPPGSIHHALQLVLTARREGRPAPPTIYGRLEYDLSTSIGPVPISFGLEPQNNVPARRPARPPIPWTAVPASRTDSPASQTSASVEPSGRRSADQAGRQKTMSPPLQNGAAAASPGSSQPIPRANFTPAVHTARPRSRSFSGFASGTQEDRMQALARDSREEGTSPLGQVKPLQITTKRSKSAMAATTVAANVPAPQRATVSHSSSVVRGVHAPSPLSLAQNNTVAVPPPRTRSLQAQAHKWRARFLSTTPPPR
ncbi:hypothetical protein BD414DRAFT_155730 [Trametes punicea]|nr:hypothetical protein BD414DRAFT_155730 [Trametes punicea]